MKYSKKGTLKTLYNEVPIASILVEESSDEVEDLIRTTAIQSIEISSRSPVHGVVQTLVWEEEITEIPDPHVQIQMQDEEDQVFLIRWGTITQREGEEHHLLTSVNQIYAKGYCMLELDAEVSRLTKINVIDKTPTQLGHINFERSIVWSSSVWKVVEIPDI